MRARDVFMVLGVMTTACGFRPEGAVAVDPPAVFQQWWQDTESCAGRRGDFSRIQWYVVAGPSFACPDGRCLGWWSDRHRVYLAGDWRDDELVVRHEMLHDIIGDGDHPASSFALKCHLTWETWYADSGKTGTNPPRHAMAAP